MGRERNALISFYFGHDKNSVFWQTKKIEGTDVESFIVLGMGYGKDKQHIYYGTNIVEDADRNSFQSGHMMAMLPMRMTQTGIFWRVKEGKNENRFCWLFSKEACNFLKPR